jgi:putative ABC transport system permease protein
MVALCACVVGTVMGLHSSWAGTRMYQVMLGLLLNVNIPIGPTLAGWATVILITLGAAVPAVWALTRQQPRELLAAVRG